MNVIVRRATAGRYVASAAHARNWRIILFCYLALLPVLALFAYVRIIRSAAASC